MNEQISLAKGYYRLKVIASGVTQEFDLGFPLQVKNDADGKKIIVTVWRPAGMTNHEFFYPVEYSHFR